MLTQDNCRIHFIIPILGVGIIFKIIHLSNSFSLHFCVNFIIFHCFIKIQILARDYEYITRNNKN